MEAPTQPRLNGVTVVVTRPKEQAAALTQALEAEGAHVVERPAVEIRPRSDASTIEALRAIDRDHYDGVIVTSVNGVNALAAHAPGDSRALPIFAIGDTTAAALRDTGYTTVTVAEVSTSEGLFDTIESHFGSALATKRFIAPTSSKARDFLVHALEDAGAFLTTVIAYDTVEAEVIEPLPVGDIDWVTFTSPSAVHAFMESLEIPEGARIACLGPTTRNAARHNGLVVDVAPEAPSIASLVDAIARSHEEG